MKKALALILVIMVLGSISMAFAEEQAPPPKKGKVGKLVFMV